MVMILFLFDRDVEHFHSDSHIDFNLAGISLASTRTPDEVPPAFPASRIYSLFWGMMRDYIPDWLIGRQPLLNDKEDEYRRIRSRWKPDERNKTMKEGTFAKLLLPLRSLFFPKLKGQKRDQVFVVTLDLI